MNLVVCTLITIQELHELYIKNQFEGDGERAVLLATGQELALCV